MIELVIQIVAYNFLSIDHLIEWLIIAALICIILHVWFGSLQCANSPDYTEPTQEPCVCPPGPPGLPGIKVGYLKKGLFILPFIICLV